jgi:hypothetical protein
MITMSCNHCHKAVEIPKKLSGKIAEMEDKANMIHIPKSDTDSSIGQWYCYDCFMLIVDIADRRTEEFATSYFITAAQLVPFTL